MSRYRYPPAMRRLINELSKLPSVGEKSATRLAYHLITGSSSQATDLADAVREAKEATRLCATCYALSESEQCEICTDSARTSSVICVVEKPADVLAIERSGGFHGRYHVLHGLWSPLKGVGPADTKIGALLERVNGASNGATEQVQELILATSTTVEGDATALYIANSVEPLGVRVSRIAQGMPKGGELEYADEMTLSHAISGRKQL